ncbi:MAG: putative toxin-antitoxin system toxin component, PIN family [Nitrososphaerota archaeon]
MRIVLDTSVLMSALISDGKPRMLLNTSIIKNHRLVLSREIVEEFVRISGEPRIRKHVEKEDIRRFLHILGTVSEIVHVISKIKISRDPQDNKILATAYDGHADYLVSGDDDLLSLNRYRGVRIVTVDRMLKILLR